MIPSLYMSCNAYNAPSDIIDIAWSRDDTMMASVGLDKMVWIWDAQTFGEQLKVAYLPQLTQI